MWQRVLWVASALPVVLGSISLADWAREDPNSMAERNMVWRGTRAADAMTHGPAPQGPIDAQDADLRRKCESAAGRLSSRLGGDFNVIVRSPFVLLGNVPPSRLDTVYSRTLQPATHALKRLYFERQPDQPVTLLLLRDEASYRACAWNLFGQRDVSVYGYYKPSSRTMVINLDAGEGTLVHELVHALADFDFPQMPIWLNEGMASLYEHCELQGDAEGQTIIPLTNWRLSVLQEAIADGTLRSMENLAACRSFRGADEATKYAEARYFCMFLAQQRLLAPYYRAFRDNHANDPGGMATLSRLFDGRPIPEIDRVFRRWVSGLQLARR